MPTAIPQESGRSDWTPQHALRWAWSLWLTLLAIPFVLFLYMVWRLMLAPDGGPTTNEPLAWRWFIGMVVYHIIVVPAAVFLRSRMFRPYYAGQTVAPRTYVVGMLLVWMALELGGLFSLAGCLVTRSLLPNMFSALVAFVLFVTMWPTGSAMTGTGKGNSDDPEKYEEPR